MPIRYRCEGCGQLLSIATRMAGRRLACPSCGHENVIPDPEAAPSVEQPPAIIFKTLDEAEVPPDEPAPADLLWDRLQSPEDEASPEPPPLSPAPLPPSPSPEPELMATAPLPLEPVEHQREEILHVSRTPVPALSNEQWVEDGEPESEEPPADAGGFSLRAPKFDSDEMDLTPMVDMTFLLLIFFMITASFVLQKTLEMPPPSPDQKGASQTLFTEEELEKNSVMVRIDDRNGIFVDDVAVAGRRELTEALRTGMTADRNEVVVLPSPETLHETVVSVIDAANEVGMQKIRLAGRQSEE